MAKYKLNPAAINPDWGGVLCLTLGNTKPDNFEDIRRKLLEHINQQKYYYITVHDIDWNIELNSPELIFKANTDSVIIRQITIDDNFLLTIIEYYFYGDGNYVRWARNVDTIQQLQSQIDELKSQLAEITKTE